MEYKLSDKNINYDGSQLRSHWINDNFNIYGDSAVAFIGKCDVDKKYMVDLEDVHTKSEIYSEEMLHFIIEHFDISLRETVMRQRLFVAIIKETLEEFANGIKFTRKGDDVYEDDSKLTISIATKSAGSGLIHTGINISSKNTPVKTKSLNEYKIEPELFAKFVLKKYDEELNQVNRCLSKVRWVS